MKRLISKTKKILLPKEDVLIVTHSKNFHADDVFATAAALLYYGVDKTGLGKFLHGFNEIKEKHSGELVRVVRTLDPKVMEKATVLMDVGREYDEKRNRFDHHQEGGAGVREDGTPYASFGLVWKKFGKKIVGSQQVADYVDRMLIKSIDANDNGIDVEKSLFKDETPVPLLRDLVRLDAEMVFSLDLEPKEMNKVFDKTFFKLIPIAQKMIILYAVKGYTIIDADKKFDAAYNKATDKRVLILDKRIKISYTKHEDCLFMIFPHLRGVWSAEAFRLKDDGSYKAKVYFPKSWAGKVDAELQKVTGVPDARFCHLGRYLASADSKEGVLKMVNLVLKEIDNK